MSSLNSGIPVVGVYLVKPLSIAAMAASLIGCGVSKSGSPAERLTISLPWAFRAFAFEAIARVEDGAIFFSRWAILVFTRIVGKSYKESLSFLKIFLMPPKNFFGGFLAAGGFSFTAVRVPAFGVSCGPAGAAVSFCFLGFLTSLFLISTSSRIAPCALSPRLLLRWIILM